MRPPVADASERLDSTSFPPVSREDPWVPPPNSPAVASVFLAFSFEPPREKGFLQTTKTQMVSGSKAEKNAQAKKHGVR